MKKWVKRGIIFLVIASVIGIGVYNYLMNKVANEIESQLSEYEKMVGNDSALKELQGIQIGDEELAGEGNATANKGSAQNGTPTNGNSNKPVALAPGTSASKDGSGPGKDTGKKQNTSFGSKQAAIRYGLSKFSAGEINHFRKMAQDGLTPAEKAEIKRIVFSRFSQSEINAIRKALAM